MVLAFISLPLVSGEKSPRLHRHFDINAVMVALREGTCYVRRAGRMTCTRPLALNYTNPRAHWPKVSVAWGQTSMSIWALKGATHSNRATWSNNMILTLLALFEARSGSCSLSPGHTRSFDLCALGLRIVKAVGLVQASCLLNFPRTPMVVFDYCAPDGIVSIVFLYSLWFLKLSADVEEAVLEGVVTLDEKVAVAIEGDNGPLGGSDGGIRETVHAAGDGPQ